MARNLHGPLAPETQQTGTRNLVTRPFVNLGEIVPAATPGTTIPDAAGGQPFVGYGTVASADANAWINLPSPVVGTELWLTGNATGYELRSNAPSTVLINAGTGGAAVESAIAASLTIWCRCITPLAWKVNNFAADATEAAEEAAAT
jgi:hypothetical protein